MSYEFDTMVKEIKSCRICEEYFGFEPNPVFRGNQNAKIMQISQAPSKNTSDTSKCFNDASGKKLREEWYQIPDEDFYNCDNFYITSIGHCYPGKSKNGGDKQPPKKCADKWLKREINLVNNEAYILIGRYAAQYFFRDKEFSELIFNSKEINDKATIVLPHPSPVNIKWFKDHPDFETERLPEIRKIIHEVLYNQT